LIGEDATSSPQSSNEVSLIEVPMRLTSASLPHSLRGAGLNPKEDDDDDEEEDDEDDDDDDMCMGVIEETSTSSP